MDHYSVMLVVDEKSPVKRFQLAKARVRQAVAAVGVFVAIIAIAAWDYTRVRADNAELADLRVEVEEQREQIQRFERTLGDTKTELEAVRELERKVRIIANLPGAVGIGGEGITELAPPVGPEEAPAGFPNGARTDGEHGLLPPAGVPVDLGPYGNNGSASETSGVAPEVLKREALTTEAARHVSALTGKAEELTAGADARNDSLEKLITQLEAKRHRLASMPSIWPAKGWMTSRFGPRVSPFTGRRQLHAGIDIAARSGSPINAPARGRVSSVGSRGPLGNNLMLDHGFGVRTFYGHAEEIFVKVGDEVERGEKIASVGSSGRSTGPHLHYAVQINGKATDPLDYIFD
jgi:murein DD-endopeptidase MepM/ murein hydrolase activator NlpD